MRHGRLPWSLTLSGVVAMTSLYLSARLASFQTLGAVPLAAIPAFGAALLLARVVPARLPDTALVRLGGRLVMASAVLTLTGWPESTYPQWYVKPDWMRIVGVLLCADLALRAWIVVAAGKGPVTKAWGRGLTVSALIFICSTTTVDRNVIPFTAPVWVVFSLVAARELGREALGMSTTRRKARRAVVVQRWVAAGVAMLIGAAIATSIMAFESGLTAWAVRAFDFGRNSRQSAEVGLSNGAQLGPIFNPSPSMTRVLRLEGARGERHLRAMAFDDYLGGAWLPRMGERGFGAYGSRPVASTRPARAIHVVALADPPGGVLALPADSVAARFPFVVERDGDGVVRAARGEAATDWDADTPGGEGGDIPFLPALDAEQRRNLTLVSASIDPGVVALARRVAGTGLPAERVHHLLVHLQQRHHYSLSFIPAPGSDPLSDFVQHDRDAHCQYFASALAIMARAAGVPSRLATGFYAHEPEGSDNTIVRGRDSHAWTECWIEGRGWQTYDATPSGGRPDEVFAPISRWRRAWETLVDLPRKIRDWATAGGLTSVLAAGAGLTVLWAGGWGIVRLVKRWRAVVEVDPFPLEARLAAVRARYAARVATEGERQRTWREAAAVQGPDVAGFLDAYAQARFGPADPEAVGRAEAALEKIEHGSSPSR